MRAWLLVMLLLLAGCASDSPDDEWENSVASQSDGSLVQRNVAPDILARQNVTMSWSTLNATWGNDTAALLKQGSVAWHGGDVANNPVSVAGQATAHPCAWEPREVYFTNQAISDFRIPYGTGTVSVILDWDATSHLRDRLRVAYMSPWHDVFLESPAFAKGTALHIDVPPQDWTDSNSSLSPPQWTMFACLENDDIADNVPPKFFWGDLRFKIDAHRISDADMRQLIADQETA